MKINRKPSSTVLKYPGSKGRLASKIIEFFPPNYHQYTYLEPYFGSGRVFFSKSRSKIETINDIDSDVTTLFQVIRDTPEELSRLIHFTPWARLEYNQSYQPTDDPIERARRFLIRSWMAIGFKSSDITGWRNVIKDINGNLTQWTYGLPTNILTVANRLRTDGDSIVQIENRPAIETIQRHNKPNVLIYADPPYVLSTRSGRIYRYEMTLEDHEVLLNVLNNHPGPVLLSGYNNPLYETELKKWHREDINCLAEQGLPRVESLWINPIAWEIHSLNNLKLF